jgi:flavin-binding protein dodecin
VPARRPRVAVVRAKAAAGVIRLSEATGSSLRSWEEAVAAAVKASDVKTPVGVEVTRLWAEVERGRLSRFHATVKIAYRQALKAASGTKA